VKKIFTRVGMFYDKRFKTAAVETRTFDEYFLYPKYTLYIMLIGGV